MLFLFFYEHSVTLKLSDIFILQNQRKRFHNSKTGRAADQLETNYNQS